MFKVYPYDLLDFSQCLLLCPLLVSDLVAGAVDKPEGLGLLG